MAGNTTAVVNGLAISHRRAGKQTSDAEDNNK
jgi:hypothetical protein